MRHPLAQATLDKTPPDEPIFVLRAQDILADTTVDFWADLAQQRLGADNPKVIAARAIARDMRAHTPRKLPD